jgi:hypothetical protein
LKTISQLLYENYLNIAGLIMNRLPPDSSENIWAQNLQKMIKSKLPIKKKQLIFTQIHKNNIILVENCRKMCFGRYSIKQLANMKKTTEQELCKHESLDINKFFSPLCQTLLLTIEEILDQIQTIEIAKSKSFYP